MLQVRARLAGVPFTYETKAHDPEYMFSRRRLIRNWVELIELGVVKQLPQDYLGHHYTHETEHWLRCPEDVPPGYSGKTRSYVYVQSVPKP